MVIGHNNDPVHYNPTRILIMFVSVNVYVVTLRSSGKLATFIVIYWSLQNDKMHANWTDILIVTMIY